jgi:hypothetical protein
MKNDLYTKFILTVIAFTLILIAIKIYEPTRKVVTLRDLYNIKFEQNKEMARQKALEIRLDTPIVSVQGGTISVE